MSEAQVYVLQNALLSKVQIRDARAAETVYHEAIIIHINVDEGTIDVQTEYGILRGIPRYCWASKDSTLTWQWPDAPDPLDPETFVPTHFFRHPIRRGPPPRKP